MGKKKRKPAEKKRRPDSPAAKPAAPAGGRAKSALAWLALACLVALLLAALESVKDGLLR